MDLYGPADLTRAREEGIKHGKQLSTTRAENISNVLFFLGAVVVVTAIAVVIVFALSRPPEPSFEFVQVGGRTCVQIVNPDYRSMNQLPTPKNLLFCEDMR